MPRGGLVLHPAQHLPHRDRDRHDRPALRRVRPGDRRAIRGAGGDRRRRRAEGRVRHRGRRTVRAARRRAGAVPDDDTGRPHAGVFVRLHLGDHRPAEGHPPAATGRRPLAGGERRRHLRPRLRLRALRRAAPRVDRHVPRRQPCLLGRRAQRGARARDHAPLRRRGGPAPRRGASGVLGVHGADPVPSAVAAAGGGAGTRRRLEPACGRAFGGAVPARGEAPDDGVVGPGDLGDLRRHGGSGDDRQAAPVVGEARHRRTRDPGHPPGHPRRRRSRAGAG